MQAKITVALPSWTWTQSTQNDNTSWEQREKSYGKNRGGGAQTQFLRGAVKSQRAWTKTHMKNDLAWEQHKNGCGLLLSCVVTSIVSHCRQLISRLPAGCATISILIHRDTLNNVYIASWHVIQTWGSKLILGWGPCGGKHVGQITLLKSGVCMYTYWIQLFQGNEVGNQSMF